MLGTQGTQAAQGGMSASIVAVALLKEISWCRSGGSVLSWPWRLGQSGGRADGTGHGTDNKESPEVYISVYT
jgi:hypothetical protein